MYKRVLNVIALVIAVALTFSALAGCSKDSSTSEPEPDTTPPTLDSAVAVDEYHVNAAFSEALNESSAENAANYLIENYADSDTLDVLNAVLLSDEKTVALETEGQAFLIYDLTVSGVTDRAGNPMAETTVQFTGSSSVDDNPPEVVSTDPADGETHVETNATVTVEFSEKMDRTSTQNSFQMRMDAQGAPVLSGTFSWESNDSRMIFTPSDALVDYSPYECQVGTGAMDISSNHLASEYSWTFVTGNAGGISGRISYSGSSEPTSVGIGIFTTPCFSGQSVADGAIPLPGDYLIYPLAPGTYYVGAYMDLDANSEPSLGEPAGIYDTNGDWNADPVVVQAGRTSTGKDFSLDYEFKMSTISGDVGKEPSVVNSDTTYVLCFDQNPSGPEEVEAVGGAIIAEGTGAYTTTPLFFGCYYVICFMDTNHNRELDVDPGTDLPVEPVGLYGFINGYGEPIFYSIFLLDHVWDIDMTLFYMDASPAPPSLASVLGRVSVRELLFSK